MSEPYEDVESSFPENYKLCFCGCTWQEHDETTGKCLYCFEDDCGGFEYDEEGTVCALALMPPDVP